MQENTVSNAMNSTCYWCYVAELGVFAIAFLGCSQTGVHSESLELNGITWTQGLSLEMLICLGIIYRLQEKHNGKKHA